MDASIVTQLDEKRKRLAMAIAARMHGRPGDGRLCDGYRLGSAAILYNPITRDLIGCLDSKCRNGRPEPCTDCIHADAARIYLVAQQTVLDLAAQRSITLDVAYSRLCTQADDPAIRAETRDKLLVLRQAARYLVIWQDSNTLSEKNRQRALGELQRYLSTPVRGLTGSAAQTRTNYHSRRNP